MWYSLTVVLLVVGLVVIVRLGLHLPTIFRGFLFYIQVSSVAVAYLPETFRLNSDVVCEIILTMIFYDSTYCHFFVTIDWLLCEAAADYLK